METDILDNDIYFTNIIPSVWLGYIVGKPNIEISTKLKKFCVLKKMKKIVRLDKDIDYWHKSRDYINEIKNQMLKNEIEKLTKYYLLKSEDLHKTYYNNTEMLILIDNRLELAVGLFLIFFKKYADMDIKQSFTAIQSKMFHSAAISEEMKYLIGIYKKD